MGVSHLVCNGDEPAAVPQGVVEDIRARIDENGLVKIEPRIPFRPGDAVRVLVGALADQIGLFQCATDEERVVLLLDMLGRRIRIKLPLADVAPAI
jgi:transcriptional antiterminator RfaH